jgi:hypothetical protein
METMKRGIDYTTESKTTEPKMTDMTESKTTEPKMAHATESKTTEPQATDTTPPPLSVFH